MIRKVAIFAVLMAVAGCSSRIGDAPAEPNPSGSTSSPSRSTAGIDVTSLDPCTALTAEQASRLGVEGPRPSTSSQGTKSCSWSHLLSEPIEAYYVDSSDKIDIESIVSVEGRSFMVGRYKAVIGRNKYGEFEKSCAIVIGVRPGQALQVNYGYEGTELAMSHDLACQKARPVAEMVIANLDRGGS